MGWAGHGVGVGPSFCDVSLSGGQPQMSKLVTPAPILPCCTPLLPSASPLGLAIVWPLRCPPPLLPS